MEEVWVGVPPVSPPSEAHRPAVLPYPLLGGREIVAVVEARVSESVHPSIHPSTSRHLFCRHPSSFTLSYPPSHIHPFIPTLFFQVMRNN